MKKSRRTSLRGGLRGPISVRRVPLAAFELFILFAHKLADFSLALAFTAELTPRWCRCRCRSRFPALPALIIASYVSHESNTRFVTSSLEAVLHLHRYRGVIFLFVTPFFIFLSSFHNWPINYTRNKLLPRYSHRVSGITFKIFHYRISYFTHQSLNIHITYIFFPLRMSRSINAIPSGGNQTAIYPIIIGEFRINKLFS